MSFLDSIKQDALAALHATVNALHATFANSLAQAGHNVSPDDHVDTLMQTAVAASAATGKPAGTAVPNYADHALASFTTSMTGALLAFAQAHLPSKFQGAAAAAAPAIGDAVNAATAGQPVNTGALVDTGLQVAAGVAAAAIPGAAPIVAAAAPLVEGIVHALEGGQKPADVATSVAQTALTAAAPAVAQVESDVVGAAASAADKVVPGAGGLVTAIADLGLQAVESKLGANPNGAAPAAQGGDDGAGAAPTADEHARGM
jgi:hypothetical protein